ncbi:MAG: hypothetical protein M3174_03900 [Actinomycetota bacterium]|nr:hypothetical protein [Actinomycetota bacterium]
MRRYVAGALVIALGLTVGGFWVAQSAGGARTVTLAAPEFSPREYSTHNNNATSVCKDPATGESVFVQSQVGGEVRGDMDNAKGSFFEEVRLPNRATVENLRLIVNDGDADTDVFALLLRRRIEHGISNAGGLTVMATARSSDGVVNTIRRFNDSSISAPRINNADFEYYVELVDCGIPEPYAVQILYSK